MSRSARDPVPTPAPSARLARQLERLATHPLLQRLMDTLPQRVLILSDTHQIVGASRDVLDAFGMCDCRELLGRRVGDVLDCRHAHNPAGGCGMIDACRDCGALRALEVRRGDDVHTRDCRIPRADSDGDERMELRVRASPLAIDDEVFFVFSFRDVGSEKRRDVLQRIFFHDLSNTACCVGGYAGMLQEQVPAEYRQYAEVIERISARLASEIEAQQELLAAESGDLSVHTQELESTDFLEHVARTDACQQAASGRQIQISADAETFAFRSDARLLGRVLTNMVKNALEASPKGCSVTLSCRRAGDRAEFSVHNDAVMPPAVQRNVFRRNFSTKGVNRGLGTHSMKLLAEQYLGGEVSFDSSLAQGTRFRVTLAA